MTDTKLGVRSLNLFVSSFNVQFVCHFTFISFKIVVVFVSGGKVTIVENANRAR